MKTTVHIHGGDYDCSELVKECYVAAGVLPAGSYMWTGNEIELLTSHGFAYRDLSDPKVGDVLWRKGHTEIYLGDNMQGGARHGDYPGGLDGRKGDQDGTEVTRSSYRTSDWTILLRYEGTHSCDGIPAAIVAAKVMDHVIDHQAHGYSQPNRDGDDTTEKIVIEWDGMSYDLEVIDVSGTVKFKAGTYVREQPSFDAKTVAKYKKGETAKVEAAVINKLEGRVFGRYVGATSGKKRYVFLGTLERVEWV